MSDGYAKYCEDIERAGCANLMPEAVAIIKDLCDAAMAADSSIRGLEMTEKVIQRAEALLAKLEGGAEDERD